MDQTDQRRGSRHSGWMRPDLNFLAFMQNIIHKKLIVYHLKQTIPPVNYGGNNNIVSGLFYVFFLLFFSGTGKASWLELMETWMVQNT